MSGQSFHAPAPTRARTYVAVYNGHSHKGCWLRLRLLVNHLAANGHKVYLVLPSLHAGLVHRNIFPVVLESNTTGWMGVRKIVWALRAARVARALARRLGDVEYIAFDTHNGACLLLERVRRVFRRKTLFIRGDAYYQGKYNEEISYGLFMRLLNKSVMRQAELIVCNNEPAVAQLHEWRKPGGCTVRMLENSSKVAPRCRLPRRRPGQPFVVGYCGQLSARKNVPFLVHAMEQLTANSFHLAIQGDWRDQEWSRALERAGRPNVTFHDWSDNVRSFYDRIDLFVLPSLHDDFANAALDAITHGVPVLLSNTGGCPQMVRWTEPFLFDLRDGERQLAKKIAAIEQNYRWACEAVGALAMQFQFDWERAAAAMLDDGLLPATAAAAETIWPAAVERRPHLPLTAVAQVPTPANTYAGASGF